MDIKVNDIKDVISDTECKKAQQVQMIVQVYINK